MFSFSTRRLSIGDLKKITSGKNPYVPGYTEKGQNVGQCTATTSRKSVFICGTHIPSHPACYYFVTAAKPWLTESLPDIMIK